jgi:allantoate deiminase
MTQLTDVGMIFVRCRGGVSHSPDETVTPEDAWLGAKVMYESVLQLG